MERMECWNIFEKTGNIEDYLHYTACTKEEQVEDLYENRGKDIGYGSTDCTSWNGFVSPSGG